MKDIANTRNVGYSIVVRTFDKVAKQFNNNSLPHLPEVLAIDEFKATKDCEGNMAFIAIDGQTHELLTLLEDRRINSLKKYFLQYSHSQRTKVKYIVMDMNASYNQLIKIVFPNAQIVTDRFHVVQQITRAFNILRVKEMNRLNRNNPLQGKQYHRLKKFWKHLLKNYDDLSDKVFYSYVFKSYMTSRRIVEELLNYSPTIKEAWEDMQVLLTHFRNKESDKFFGLLRDIKKNSTLPDYFTKKLTFLLTKEKSISLALELPYSNGCVEGTNNKIKMIKRTGFGYRLNSHLFARIMLCQEKNIN